MPDSLSRTFAALADPTRRAILADLATGKLLVGELVNRHHLSQPAISKHLKVLQTAGLIRRGRQAQTRPCSLDPEGLKAAATWLEAYRQFWESAFGKMDELIATLNNPEKANG